MKQMIVLISMVVLGLFIAGIVLGFQTDAQKLADGGSAGITKLADIAQNRDVTDPTAK